ncbi:hypothetical protein LTR36_007634 [Oleoguttula mirabilis]|uniref:Uncharacterized protein n=1 Tax=Oleoguttula mirabilis TaxID=1507867 RepID=A0AAV9JUN1_9PEZI|nr:hypothetical protein LTR36_007634 [Oleoguttula mirabilis]
MAARERSTTIESSSANENTPRQEGPQNDSNDVRGTQSPAARQMGSHAKGKRPMRDMHETPPPKRLNRTMHPEVRPDESPKRSHHRRYDKCGLSTKRKRSHLIDSISSNWMVPYPQWLPEHSAPTTDQLHGGRVSSFVPLEPRDWSTPYLAAIEFLSTITRNDPQTAHDTLAAIYASRRKPGHMDPLVVRDIGEAIAGLIQRSDFGFDQRSPTVPAEGIAGPSGQRVRRVSSAGRSELYRASGNAQPIKVEHQDDDLSRLDITAAPADPTDELHNYTAKIKALVKACEEGIASERIHLQGIVRRMELFDRGRSVGDAILVVSEDD